MSKTRLHYNNILKLQSFVMHGEDIPLNLDFILQIQDLTL